MTESFDADKIYSFFRHISSYLTLKVDSVGYECSIHLNDQLIGVMLHQEGVMLAVFDPITDQLLYYTSFSILENRDRFEDLTEELRDNQLIALLIKAKEPLIFSDRWQKFRQSLGSQITLPSPFQGSWAIIGRKGEKDVTESFSSGFEVSCQRMIYFDRETSEIAYPILTLITNGHKGKQSPSIKIDDQSLSLPELAQKSLIVLVFDELTGYYLNIATFSLDSAEESEFCQLIASLPHGRGVAIAIEGISALSAAVQQSLTTVGSRLVEKCVKGQSLLIIGYKGTPPGSALENLAFTSSSELILKVWLSPTLSPSAYWQPPQKLYPPNPEQDNAFGGAIALREQMALIAAPLCEDSEQNRHGGIVYLFQFTQGQWQYQQRLSPHDLQYQAVFGKSVAIERDNILIGAYLADAYWKISAGAVYSFTRKGNTWQQTQKIQPHDLHPEDGFGCAIALEQQTVLVGAYNSLNLLRQATGAVYVLEHQMNGWQDKQKLQPLSLEKGDCFGHSLALEGNFAIVGAYAAQETGVVYTFEREAGIWQEKQLLQPSPLQKGDCFGYSVALERDVLLIGAKNAKKGRKIGVGAVYVFHHLKGQWQWVQTWQPSDLGGYEHFGHSLSLNEGLAVVGADQGSSATQAYTGAVYTFQRTANGWQPYLKLYPLNGQAGDRFGYTVAVKDSLILVGAPTAEVFGRKRTGVVYPGHFSP